MNNLILFILWVIIGFLGAVSTQSHIFGLFIICAILFPIISIILFFRALSLFFELLGKLFLPKKKYKEINFEEKEEYYRDKNTEHITLNHPEYIGLLTKIDKKRIAEEYLENLKKEKKHGKNK